ncbi:hypothetical protein DL89DRAFT_259650 [Linderina pennispora]|uniref:Uncharacterized protein n=1 Tax=Linderina pennispora TaxID=61395 RepID=A0A1Y1W1X9_9FUNG|nr:uncharacterized protein DL89DRAFT_259650 [Linderina pennispora]ORX67124.1 hypothetical protein DL89DRAFT_259650 [Linderina pennispora]
MQTSLGLGAPMQIMHALAASTLIISVSHAQLGRDNRYLHPGHELYDALGLHDIPMQLQAGGLSDASLSADEQKARLHGIFAPPATHRAISRAKRLSGVADPRYGNGRPGCHAAPERQRGRQQLLLATNIAHVLDTRGFDSVLDGYFNTSSEFEYINSFFGCESWSGYPTPRYRIAYTCRSLLESAEAKLCNKLHQPPPLCKDSCSVVREPVGRDDQQCNAVSRTPVWPNSIDCRLPRAAIRRRTMDRSDAFQASRAVPRFVGLLSLRTRQKTKETQYAISASKATTRAAPAVKPYNSAMQFHRTSSTWRSSHPWRSC